MSALQLSRSRFERLRNFRLEGFSVRPSGLCSFIKLAFKGVEKKHFEIQDDVIKYRAIHKSKFERMPKKIRIMQYIRIPDFGMFNFREFKFRL